MKKLITAALIAGLCAVAIPSYSLWYCTASNNCLNGKNYWVYHSSSLDRAKAKVLEMCNADALTVKGCCGFLFLHSYRPATCYPMNCTQQPPQ